MRKSETCTGIGRSVANEHRASNAGLSFTVSFDMAVLEIAQTLRAVFLRLLITRRHRSAQSDGADVQQRQNTLRQYFEDSLASEADSRLMGRFANSAGISSSRSTIMVLGVFRHAMVSAMQQMIHIAKKFPSRRCHPDSTKLAATIAKGLDGSHRRYRLATMTAMPRNNYARTPCVHVIVELRGPEPAWHTA